MHVSELILNMRQVGKHIETRKVEVTAAILSRRLFLPHSMFQHMVSVFVAIILDPLQMREPIDIDVFEFIGDYL